MQAQVVQSPWSPEMPRQGGGWAESCDLAPWWVQRQTGWEGAGAQAVLNEEVPSSLRAQLLACCVFS